MYTYNFKWSYHRTGTTFWSYCSASHQNLAWSSGNVRQGPGPWTTRPQALSNTNGTVRLLPDCYISFSSKLTINQVCSSIISVLSLSFIWGTAKMHMGVVLNFYISGHYGKTWEVSLKNLCVACSDLILGEPSIFSH